MRYMIHAVPKRMWYVNEYLIPSMLAQGITRDSISVYVDEEHEGNLRACMRAFSQVDNDDMGTWHLQDDVILSHDFKEQTEKEYDKIVCGFCSQYDDKMQVGEVPVQNMWFSFLCIYIPNKLARECANWVFTYMIGNPIYKKYWEQGVNDDWMFRQYIWTYYKNNKALNLVPNIVDHIDYLIGGTVNSIRNKITVIRSKYWNDEYLVDDLAKRLEKRNESN